MEGPWVILPSLYYTLFLTVLHTLPLAALHTLPRRRRWGHLLTERVKRPWLQRKVNIRQFCFFTRGQGPFFHISTPRFNVDVTTLERRRWQLCYYWLLLTQFCFWRRVELYLAPTPQNLRSGLFSFFWLWYFKNCLWSIHNCTKGAKVRRVACSPATCARIRWLLSPRPDPPYRYKILHSI